MSRLAAIAVLGTALVACARTDAPAPVYNALIETRDPSIGAHMVGSNESIDQIAAGYAVTIDDILAANNIASASEIAPGQRLYLPESPTLTGLAALDPPLSTASPKRGAVFVARASDQPMTPEQNAQKQDQDSATGFAPMNNSAGNLVSVSREVLAPLGDAAASTTTAIAAPLETTPATVAATTAPPVSEPVRLASNLSPERWADPLATGFRWPVRGPTLSEFGAKSGGLKNDGINIGANMGTPVEAAADGEVVYTGQAVEGFGNLILVKHKNNFVTAYGHLSRVDVVKGQNIAAGEIIGGVGQTGSVSAPQLHFQVRQGTKILNPGQHLSRGSTLTAGL